MDSWYGSYVLSREKIADNLKIVAADRLARSFHTERRPHANKLWVLLISLVRGSTAESQRRP